MVLEIYEICVQGQNERKTENPIVYKVETYLDRLFVPEIHIIQKFVIIVWAVIEIYVICVHGYTDRQTIRFFTRLRPI